MTHGGVFLAEDPEILDVLERARMVLDAPTGGYALVPLMDTWKVATEVLGRGRMLDPDPITTYPPAPSRSASASRLSRPAL